MLSTVIAEDIVTKEEVSKVYTATFDRVPDKDGLTYWLSSGLSIEDIASSFFDQNETKVKYPEGITTEEFINTVYQNLFIRDSKEEGLEYWKTELESGSVLKSNFILAIINGALDGDAVILEEKQELSELFLDKDISQDYSKDVMNLYGEEGKESAIEMINGLYSDIIELKEELEILKKELEESTQEEQDLETITDLPETSDTTTDSSNIDPNCKVKGNISYNSGRKYYFLFSHRDYEKVKINRSGERCFSTEAEAQTAGWTKAPE